MSAQAKSKSAQQKPKSAQQKAKCLPCKIKCRPQNSKTPKKQAWKFHQNQKRESLYVHGLSWPGLVDLRLYFLLRSTHAASTNTHTVTVCAFDLGLGLAWVRFFNFLTRNKTFGNSLEIRILLIQLPTHVQQEVCVPNNTARPRKPSKAEKASRTA